MHLSHHHKLPANASRKPPNKLTGVEGEALLLHVSEQASSQQSHNDSLNFQTNAPVLGVSPSSCISLNRRSAVASWPPAWQMDSRVE